MSDYYPAPDELRDAWINESTSFPREAETVEAKTLEGQMIPIDGGESLTEWLDDTERNQRENEREAEEQTWHEQELLQNETDA